MVTKERVIICGLEFYITSKSVKKDGKAGEENIKEI